VGAHPDRAQESVHSAKVHAYDTHAVIATDGADAVREVGEVYALPLVEWRASIPDVDVTVHIDGLASAAAGAA
jgi:hypothetical protein